MKKYHLTYRTELFPDGLEDEDIPDEVGACDRLVVAVITDLPDGSREIDFGSVDGETGEKVNSRDVFTAWWLMSEQLARDPDLSSAQRSFAEAVFSAYPKLEAASRTDPFECVCPMCQARRDEDPDPEDLN